MGVLDTAEASGRRPRPGAPTAGARSLRPRGRHGNRSLQPGGRPFPRAGKAQRPELLGTPAAQLSRGLCGHWGRWALRPGPAEPRPAPKHPPSVGALERALVSPADGGRAQSPRAAQNRF